MPRVNIYFTDDTLKELREFLEREYGKHRALSLTVQQAVKEYLDRRNGNNPESR